MCLCAQAHVRACNHQEYLEAAMVLQMIYIYEQREKDTNELAQTYFFT